MKKLDLSQYIHNSFLGDWKATWISICESFLLQKQNKFTKVNSLALAFPEQEFEGFSLILPLKRLRDWQGMMGERRIKQSGSWTETLLLFWPMCNLLFIFRLHKNKEKSYEHYFLSSRGDQSKACWWLHGHFAPKVVRCHWACTRRLPLSPGISTVEMELHVGQWNYIFKPWKCGKLQLWLLW